MSPHPVYYVLIALLSSTLCIADVDVRSNDLISTEDDLLHLVHVSVVILYASANVESEQEHYQTILKNIIGDSIDWEIEELNISSTAVDNYILNATVSHIH